MYPTSASDGRAMRITTMNKPLVRSSAAVPDEGKGKKRTLIVGLEDSLGPRISTVKKEEGDRRMYEERLSSGRGAEHDWFDQRERERRRFVDWRERSPPPERRRAPSSTSTAANPNRERERERYRERERDKERDRDRDRNSERRAKGSDAYAPEKRVRRD
ncbi:hypothetical protein CF319_g7333 [Tilletia indica]|nr:hypothetical protein CF319_g7333 [Tilletia indica]